MIISEELYRYRRSNSLCLFVMLTARSWFAKYVCLSSVWESVCECEIHIYILYYLFVFMDFCLRVSLYAALLCLKTFGISSDDIKKEITMKHMRTFVSNMFIRHTTLLKSIKPQETAIFAFRVFFNIFYWTIVLLIALEVSGQPSVRLFKHPKQTWICNSATPTLSMFTCIYKLPSFLNEH